MQQKVYIAAIQRSAIGKFLGSLSDMSPVDMGVQLVSDVLVKANIPSEAIDEVIVGNVLSAGHGQNIARQIVRKAELPEHIPAYTLNMVCGSGLKSVYEAFIKIKYGMSHAIIAGGVESMSQAAYLMPLTTRKGNRIGDMTMVDSLLRDGLTDGIDGYHMGITAENLATAYGISRQEQDEYALSSQQKACQARNEGRFQAEITPIEVMTRRGVTTFAEDEYINDMTTLEQLARLKPAFDRQGTVTAGNASGINDGGAFVCLVSQHIVDTYNLQPLAEVIAFSQMGVDPTMMGIGPVAAVSQLLTEQSLSVEDIALFELNEAFAVQSLAVERLLAEKLHGTVSGLRAKTNINGGAIALGHPIGASGTRILATLTHSLPANAYGVASLCIGGGMGIATLIRKCDV